LGTFAVLSPAGLKALGAKERKNEDGPCKKTDKVLPLPEKDADVI